MTQELFKKQRETLESHGVSSESNLNKIISGNQDQVEALIKSGEISRFSSEIVQFIFQNKIPFEDVSLQDRLVNLEREARFGAELAKSTSSLFESLPKRNSETGEVSDYTGNGAFGLRFLDLENTLSTYFNSHPSFKDLPFEEKEILITKKIREFIQRPESLYPGIKKLLDSKIRSLSESPPEGMSEGTRNYLLMYSQMFYPLTNEQEYIECERFEVPKKGGSYYFCRDSEILFSLRLDLNDTEAKTTVFQKEGKPILLQKTGGYTELDEDKIRTTNATAINLEPIFVSGILYPPGTLFGVQKRDGNSYVKNGENQVYETSEIEGLVPLRLSIFSCSQDGNERQNSFGVQYDSFIQEVEEREVSQGSIEEFKILARNIISSS